MKNRSWLDIGVASSNLHHEGEYLRISIPFSNVMWTASIRRRIGSSQGSELADYCLYSMNEYVWPYTCIWCRGVCICMCAWVYKCFGVREFVRCVNLCMICASEPNRSRGLCVYNMVCGLFCFNYIFTSICAEAISRYDQHFESSISPYHVYK